MGAQIETANTRAGNATQGFSTKAAALGVAVAGATRVLQDFGRAAADDEASQMRMQQAVENTGKSYDQYAQRIDAAIKKGQDLAFSDDQTRDALVRLNLVTNDTGKSLDELGVVMDFARAKNIDMGTAADIVGKVMGGNLGILARYGIQLDANATKEQALAAIQQRSAGQASTYANTTLGEVDKMKDRWSEFTETIGRHEGAMQSLLLVLPAIQAGYAGIAGVLAGMGGMSGLLGSVGLLAQVGTIAGIGALAYGYQQNAMGSTAINTGANKFFLGASSVLNYALPGNPFDTQKYKDQMAANTAGDALNAYFNPGNMDADYVVAAANGALGSPGMSVNGKNFTRDELERYIVAQAQALGVSPSQYLSMVVNGQVPGASSDIMRDPTSGAYMTTGQYIAYSNARNPNATLSSTGSEVARTFGGQPRPGDTYWTPTRKPYRPGDPGYVLQPGDIGYTGPMVTSTRYLNQHAVMPPGTNTMGGGGFGITPVGVGGMVTPIDATPIQYPTRAEADALKAAVGAIHQYAQGLGITVATSGVTGGVIGASNASGVAARAGTANSAASAGFQVAVGNTNAIGQQVQQVNDWAKSLINVSGEYGKIDELLSRGVINQQEYNNAQQAGTSIFSANAKIQDDILKIQTDQAPIIAKLTEEQQRYMDHLAGLNPAQQALRLAYMDTGEAAKAQTALTLAAAAANGELGAVGEKTATAMISAAAEADPYLRQMLEDMGVISVGADGTITVNFDDVKSANDEMGNLITAVEGLISIIAQTLMVTIDYQDHGALAEAYALEAVLNNIAGTYQANVVIYQSGGNAPSGPQFGGGYNGLTAYANGGTAYDPLMPRFANGGGVRALVGEFGPEVVTLNRGDQVMPSPGSRSVLGRGGPSVHIANVTVVTNDPRDFTQRLREYAIGNAR